MLRLSRVFCLGAILLGACEAETQDPSILRQPVTTLPAASRAPSLLRTYQCPYRGYLVELPRPGFRVRNRSYDPLLPPRKFRNRLTVLRQGAGPVITLDTWENPLDLDLQAWFEQILAGTVREQARREIVPGTSHRIPVLLFAEPRSPQSPPRRVAVFSRNGLVFRLRLLNADDREALAAFERMLQSFHLPGGRP